MRPMAKSLQQTSWVIYGDRWGKSAVVTEMADKRNQTVSLRLIKK